MANCNNGYEANEWCLKYCKGELCCRNNAGAYSPKDFPDLSYSYLWKKLSEGKISIDHAFIEDQELGAFVRYGNGYVISLEKIMRRKGLLFLRGRNVGAPIVDMIRFEQEPRTCINWNPETGCSLKFEERPMECRLLEPRPYCDCIDHITPKELAEEWRKANMQEVLFHLAREFWKV